MTQPLLPGQLILFYTDGITDARNNKQERFGVERLKDTLRHTTTDPGQAGDTVMHAVEQFLADTPQLDDIALVCFGRDEVGDR
jgi:sigma-B regulation protein RsbU (phosphoserine phosphatase)